MNGNEIAHCERKSDDTDLFGMYRHGEAAESIEEILSRFRPEKNEWIYP